MVSSALNRLAPIDFTRYIDRLTERFTGREWLFEQIDRWLQQGNEQFYLLTGEPGVGKSAIAAKLTQIRSDIAAYHFCRAGDVETVRPGRVLRSLAAQLGKTLPHYGEALAKTIDPIHLRIDVNINIESLSNSQVTGIYIENLKESDPRDELEILLRAPLAALPDLYAEHNEPLPTLKVLLIDSLDEAVTTTGRDNMATLLAALSQADGLPSWIRFILTARPDLRVLQQFELMKLYKLEELLAQNLEDIERYVGDRVQELVVQPESEFQARLEQAELSAETLVREVKELSKGNFLYTRLLMDGIGTGELSVKNLSILPKTLNEVYQRFLRHRCPFRKWSDRYQSILGTLTVTQEPVSEEQLVKFTGIDSEQLKDALGVLQQFLDEINDEQGQMFYAIFHQSLREYLIDKKHNHDFWCDPQEEHQRIIEHYYNDAESWEKLDWSNADNYGLLHLPKHLYAQVDIAESKNEQQEEVSKYRQNLYNLICKSLMWAKLARFDSHQFFAEDVKLAIDISQAENPPNIVQQFRNSLVYATLGALATNVPPEVIGALVRVGELRKAQGFAALVPDSAQRSRAWLQISEVVMVAVQKAETTQNEAQQMLAEIAKDGLTKALQAAETIQDEAQKAEMLAEVATALARIDDREELHRVLEAAIAIVDEKHRANSLSGIVEALIQVKDIDALHIAFKAGEPIQQTIPKVKALSEIGLALAQVGYPQKLYDVLTIVRQIEKVDQKVEASRLIALAMGKNKDVAGLEQILTMIDSLEIQKETTEEQKSEDELIQILQRRKEAARKFLTGIRDSAEALQILYQVRIRGTISLAMAQLGNRVRATEIIQEALALEEKIAKSKPTLKAEMLGEIGIAIAQIGGQNCLSHLFSRAKEIDDDVPQNIMMRKIGLALAEAGNVEGVCQTIDLLRTEFFGTPRQAKYHLVGIPLKLEHWATLPKNRSFVPKFFDESKKVKKSRHEKLIAEIVGKTIEVLTYAEFSEQFNQDSRYVRRFNQKPKYSHSGYLGWEVKVVEIVDEEYRAEIFLKQIANWASELILNGKENVIERLAKLSAIDQVKALEKLAPLAVQIVRKQESSEFLYHLLTLAEAIEQPVLRRNALGKLALPFAHIREKEVLLWLLKTVQIIEAEKPKAEALSLLAEKLTSLGTQDALKQVLLITESIEEDKFKQNTLREVFSVLETVRDKELLTQVLPVLETVKRPDYKVAMLIETAFANNLLGNEDKFFQMIVQATTIADAIEQEDAQINALSMIIELKTMFGANNFLPWSLDIVNEFNGWEYKVIALSKIMQALAKLKDLEGLFYVFDLIVETEDQESKVKLFVCMARAMASLESQDGYFKVLETASREFIDGDEEVNDQKIVNCSCYALFLSQLLPLEEQLGAASSDIAKLLEIQKAKTVMTLAFIRSRYLENEEECKAAYENIKRVIPSLVQLADQELWDIVLIVVQQIEREDYRAKTLYELASVLVLPMHLHTLDCVLNVAWRIQEETCRVEPLSAVAVALTTIGGQNLLSRALEIVNSFNDKNYQAEILLRISQILAESEDCQGLYQLLNIVQTLSNEIRTEVLSKIVCYLSRFGDEARASSTWNSQLIDLHQNERSGIFHILSAGIPLISNTDQGKTLWELYEALSKVESWWSEPKNRKVIAPTSEEASTTSEEASTLIDIGRQYLQQEQWLKALECFEKCLAISRQLGNRQQEALALHHLGQVHLKQEQWTEAIEYLKQDLALCHELNDIRGQAQNLSNLAVAYGGKKLHKKAIECLKQSISIMHQQGFREDDHKNLYDLAATFYNLGGSYLQLNHWAEAIDSLDQALAIYHKLNDAEEAADTLQILISLYGKIEQVNDGIAGKLKNWFHKKSQKTDQNKSLNRIKLTQYLELLAHIRCKQGHWGEGIEYYRLCLDMLHQLDNVAKEAHILNEMGNIYAHQSEPLEAIQCYEQSLKIARQIKNLEKECGCLNNLGSVYNEQRNWMAAERCFKESLTIARQLSARETQAELLHSLGCNCTDQGRWAEAIPYFEQDLEIRRELGESSKEVIILSNLSQLYSIIGNEAKAKILRQEARAALNKIDPNSPEAEEVKQTAKRLQVDSDT